MNDKFISKHDNLLFSYLQKTMLIISWNIDRLDESKWKYIKEGCLNSTLPKQVDILFIQELKCKEEIVRMFFSEVSDTYDSVINCHKPAHYHGVAMLIKKGNVKWSLDHNFIPICASRSDTKGSADVRCGRIIAVKVEIKDLSFLIVNTYSPNSGIDIKQPLKNLDYRINQWDRGLFNELEKHTKENVIWLGDINVCLEDIDVTHPSRLRGRAGFTKEERKSFGDFLSRSGWIDIWRHQHKDVKEYSYVGYSNSSNKCMWRLDNTIISPGMLDKVKYSFIIPQSLCTIRTDHLPIGIVL